MPFKSELNYFYLYVRDYIERRHNLHCERADEQVLTDEIINKIRAYIEDADVVIADCTGQNPNVFYELGMADSLRKPVILLTGEDPDKVKLPLDVRTRDFIVYDLNDHKSFLNRLDNALNNILFRQDQFWYEQALAILEEFQQAIGATVGTADRELFSRRLREAELQGENYPDQNDKRGLANFLLLKIITDARSVGLARQVIEWLDTLNNTP
jgi:nucleoside 2-deoxyribosyltransferase